MGLFSRKVETHACPICGQPVQRGKSMLHWETHVQQIPPGQGAASGEFTWRCECGPCGRKWPNKISAASAIAIHMYRVHAIPLDSPLDNTAFLTEMEHRLGLH